MTAQAKESERAELERLRAEAYAQLEDFERKDAAKIKDPEARARFVVLRLARKRASSKPAPKANTKPATTTKPAPAPTKRSAAAAPKVLTAANSERLRALAPQLGATTQQLISHALDRLGPGPHPLNYGREVHTSVIDARGARTF